MKYLLSPAKSLNDQPDLDIASTQPVFLRQSQQLIDQLQAKSRDDIRQLMSLSEKLAQLNVDRYQNWSVQNHHPQTPCAIRQFTGDVYQGLDAQTLSAAALDYAQRHVRILSGLYGILRPFDRMQPYRLEMGTALATTAGHNLYTFWGEQLAQYLLDETQTDEPIVNLASNEYNQAALTTTLREQRPIITPVFKDEKNGQYKIISFYAKKARGLMARYACLNQISHPEALKQFDLAGYAFDEEMTAQIKTKHHQTQWVFSRSEAVIKQQIK